MGNVVWAEPRNISSISDCYFYHTMDIPNHGTVHGDWDLRGREASYLGNINLQGKRVLEVGTASGHLCFTMERMGAEVVAYDLSNEQDWDIVPYDGYDYGKHTAELREHIRRLNDGFWIAHRAYGSHAKMTYGTVYEMPDDIGQFDICIFGSILLHLRDPFLALQRALAHVKETAVVTDLVPSLTYSLLAGGRLILQILGFVHTKTSFHRQLHRGKELQLYTVVGHRKGAPAADLGAHGEESDSALSWEDYRSVLKEVTLQSIRFSHIVKHLLKRGIRAVPKRLLTRS
jgi:2-polyprenyl-3-methyl-5-hydroxy-6-metoxy-1,4-benzoquinol methylase